MQTPPPLPETREPIVLLTSDRVEGRAITRYLGIVKGVIVRSPGLGKALSGAFRAFGEGNIAEFAEACEKARQQAMDLMTEDALALGADAVISIRFDTGDMGNGLAEVLCYGTAVSLNPVEA